MFKPMVISTLCVAGLCAAAARADTVEMLNSNLKLEGKVWLEDDKFIILLVNDETGRIKISKDKIKTIEYDVETRLGRLTEDDYAGRYDVGVWAMEKGLFAEAIGLLEKCKGQEGPGPDLLKLLGRAYEQRQQLAQALENYTDYLMAHPEDAEITERVAKLKQQVGTQDPDVTTAAPVLDGLENSGIWTDEKWPKGISCKVGLIADSQNPNNKIRVAQSAGGTGDKVAFSRTDKPMNLTGMKELGFRAYLKCDKPAANFGLAFINAKGEFYETRQFRIPNGSWSTHAITLETPTFKAEKSNWMHELELGGKESITRIVFLAYSQQPFTLYIDDVFFK